MRETSLEEVVGIRLAIALIQRMRLSFARTRMRCVLESGSPVQSWLKHRMSRPRSGWVECFFSILFFGAIMISDVLQSAFAVNEPSLPDLKIHQRPYSLVVIFAGVVFCYQFRKKLLVENSS